MEACLCSMSMISLLTLMWSQLKSAKVNFGPYVGILTYHEHSVDILDVNNNQDEVREGGDTPAIEYAPPAEKGSSVGLLSGTPILQNFSRTSLCA